MGITTQYNLQALKNPYQTPQSTFDYDKLANRIGTAVAEGVNQDSLGNTANIIPAITAKAQKAIDKSKAATEKYTAQRDALQNLQTLSNGVSSAIQNISSNNAGSVFSNLSTSGLPPSITVQPSFGAQLGVHSIAVGSVASKQTIVIQNKDAAGNPVPFVHNAPDVTVAAGGVGNTGYFLSNSTFNIYSDDDNLNVLATITIPAGPQTLAQIAALVNASNASTVLTATVTSDATGDKLVLQSTSAGVAGNFYVSARDIVGQRDVNAPNFSALEAAKVAEGLGGATGTTVLAAVLASAPESVAGGAAAIAGLLGGASAASVVTAINARAPGTLRYTNANAVLIAGGSLNQTLEAVAATSAISTAGIAAAAAAYNAGVGNTAAAVAAAVFGVVAAGTPQYIAATNAAAAAGATALTVLQAVEPEAVAGVAAALVAAEGGGAAAIAAAVTAAAPWSPESAVAQAAVGGGITAVLCAVIGIGVGQPAVANSGAGAGSALASLTAIENALNCATAINTLSVAVANDEVQSIDIYTINGNPFYSTTSFTLGLSGADENVTFQPNYWDIGTGTIDVANVNSLQDIADSINAYQASTGVQASIVAAAGGGGFILRVTALPGVYLNYSPQAMKNIFLGDVVPTATQVRSSGAADTNIIIDGVNYNIGGSLTLTSGSVTPGANNANVPNISSITVSAPVQTTQFAITQDVSGLTTAITTLVTAINEAQQFIAQQQEEEAPLLANNTLNQLQNFISNFAGSASNNMSLSNMGITWTNYVPSPREKREGNVPAQYLQINATTLANTLASNFTPVQQFLTGTLTGGTAVNASFSAAQVSEVISVPQFDLVVTSTTAVNAQGQPIICTATANGISLNVTYLGGNSLLLAGAAGTAFAGMSMLYNYTGAGGPLNTMGNNTPAGSISGIKVYNGAALTLSSTLDSYLGQYGYLNQSITETNTTLQNSQKKTLRLFETREKKIAKAQTKIQKIKLQMLMAKQLAKVTGGNNNKG